MNTIKVPHGCRNQLAKIFGVSLPTVRKALKGKTDNDLARKIRKAALENKGREQVEMDSEFTAENKWVMRIGAATIIADLTSGFVETKVNGTTVKTYQNPTINQMATIQLEALNLLNQ